MYKPQIRTLTSDQSPEKVYRALEQVAGGSTITLLGFSSTMSVVQADPTAGMIAFTNSKSAFSWQLEFVGAVTASGTGTQLEVTAGGQDTAPKALMDNWKHGKAADQVIEQVRAHLAAV